MQSTRSIKAYYLGAFFLGVLIAVAIAAPIRAAEFGLTPTNPAPAAFSR